MGGCECVRVCVSTRVCDETVTELHKLCPAMRLSARNKNRTAVANDDVCFIV